MSHIYWNWQFITNSLIIPTFPKLKKIPCRYTGFDDDDRFEIWDFRQLIVWMVPLAKPIYISRSAYGLATASPETRYVNIQTNNALKKKAAAFRLYRSSLTFSWHSVFSKISLHFRRGKIGKQLFSRFLYHAPFLKNQTFLVRVITCLFPVCSLLGILIWCCEKLSRLFFPPPVRSFFQW